MLRVILSGKRGTKIGGLAASVAIFSLLSLSGAGAVDMSSDALVKALTPPKTRSLSGPTPAQKADADFIHSLKGKTRSLTAPERTRLQTVAADKPSVDLTMEFDYNSAELNGESMKTADALGKALSNAELKDKTFVLSGHTDAKGGDDLNQRLSERRADAVKQYLVKTYSIDPAKLITVGFGKTQLKNSTDPFAPENRRVQTVNVLPYESASR